MQAPGEPCAVHVAHSRPHPHPSVRCCTHTYGHKISLIFSSPSVPHSDIHPHMLSQHHDSLSLSHTICITHSHTVSHSLLVWLIYTVTLTWSRCHPHSPRACHTAFSRHLWLCPTHPVSSSVTHRLPCDTHSSHVLPMLHAVPHNLSLSQSLDVTTSPPNSVSGTSNLTGSHAVTCLSSLPTHRRSHTRLPSVTHGFTVIPVSGGHKISQPHTKLWRHALSHGSTHSHSLLTSHAIPWYPSGARTVSLLPSAHPCVAHTQPSGLSRQPPDGHTGAPAAHRRRSCRRGWTFGGQGAGAGGRGMQTRLGDPDTEGWRGLEARGRELKMDWDKGNSKRRGERWREGQSGRERRRDKFGELET